MDLLLDTHVLLWWDADDPELHPAARRAIEDPTNRIFVSAASAWEIAIKQARSRLAFTGSVAKSLLDNGFLALPIALHHAERAGSLPPHHADPFDRMLVAQAELEQLVLVTQDRVLRAYSIPILGLSPRTASAPRSEDA